MIEWFWLRSPYPNYYIFELDATPDNGNINNNNVNNNGVRPALSYKPDDCPRQGSPDRLTTSL